MPPTPSPDTNPGTWVRMKNENFKDLAQCSICLNTVVYGEAAVHDLGDKDRERSGWCRLLEGEGRRWGCSMTSDASVLA
ncbi:hypothetical protein E2562_032783 [Oryza meyeriana var. granulata]|uniref:Uncharacterized protein n=1 Tax=Oryza meyeriana var. granulata TaxID=110450 RepID=A0A6G1F0N6_9ORYZ|nr:hypothetical protein E2562_032783 [Oryza meyeriana var. granulata]